MGEDDDAPAGFASPPCFMHELDPDYTGSTVVDPQGHADVMRWRKPERQRLIAERLAIAAERRRDHAEAIARGLDRVVGDVAGRTISAYWPFRGEPDLRPWLRRVAGRGARCALPVVVERGRPLVFRAWRHGDPMARGVWNILVPAEGEEVVPDIVVAPLVGFDRHCYRLGYGGGFFDRTLAALQREGTPQIVGVGYAQAAIPTIHPQPHDIPMNTIVTERDTFTAEGAPATAG